MTRNMTREEAERVVEACRGWNTGQRSVSLAMGGARTDEDDLLDARRAALTRAWRVLAGEDTP
jgi:hypothetical protein